MSAADRFDNEKRRRPDHHARQAMLTPGYVLEPVRALLGEIGLDPCTEPDNPTGARLHYSLPNDGCSMPWEETNIFCNPPYGEARDRWVDRCIAEAPGKRIVLLIPAHPDTRTFQRAIAACTSVLFCKGRLKFGVLRDNGRQEAASHGSALIGFNVDLGPLRDLGMVLSPASDLAARCSSVMGWRERWKQNRDIPGADLLAMLNEIEALRAEILRPAQVGLL